MVEVSRLGGGEVPPFLAGDFGTRGVLALWVGKAEGGDLEVPLLA